VDRIFGYPNVAGEFFAILRAWIVEGQGGINVTWQKLRLIITHSQEVYASLPFDLKQSPFNVGVGIPLPEFTAAQVQDLAHRHQLNWTDSQVESLMTLTGGHPYLVQTALYHIASQNSTLDQFLTLAPTDQGVYYDHLHRHLITLRERPALATAMRRVVLSEKSVRIDDDDKFKLRSLGLVTFQGDEVMPLCGLYRQYFRTHLIS
jgi:hypothetical protein